MSGLEATSSMDSPLVVTMSEGFQETRREIREEYRKLLARTAESLDDLDMNEVTNDVKQANDLVENVLLPREGTFDTALIKQCSEILKKKSDQLQTGPTFSPELFAKRLIASMKNMNPEDVILPGEGDVTQLTAENWEKLNEDVAPLFHIAPGFTYVYGAFRPDEPEVKKVEKQRREKILAADRISAVTRPKEISDSTMETEEQRVARKIKIMRAYLDVAYKQMDQKPISYYDFLVNPTSFGKTVENMFYFTFLLKDGFAKYRLNDEEPIIEPLPPTPEGEETEAKHIVTSINWDQWEEIVSRRNITEAFFDLGD